MAINYFIIFIIFTSVDIDSYPAHGHITGSFRLKDSFLLLSEDRSFELFFEAVSHRHLKNISRI